jgi:hypothetical protein
MNLVKEFLQQMIERMSDAEVRQLLEFANTSSTDATTRSPRSVWLPIRPSRGREVERGTFRSWHPSTARACQHPLPWRVAHDL